MYSYDADIISYALSDNTKAFCTSLGQRRIHSEMAALSLPYWRRRLSRDYEPGFSARHGTVRSRVVFNFTCIEKLHQSPPPRGLLTSAAFG